MSRTSLDYQSLRADLRAESAAERVRQVSADGVTYLQSLYAMPVGVRRENLLALAVAFHNADAPADLRPHVAAAVRYHSLAADPFPAWGRLLVAVRECDKEQVDRALDRLVAEVAA